MSHENHEVARVGLDTFLVASVDKPDDMQGNYFLREKLENAMKAQGIGYKRCTGCYAGKMEISYIFNAKHWNALAAHFVQANQESVLVLGPKPSRDGFRPATLHFLDASLPVSLGYFVPCSEEHARKQEAWTAEQDNGEHVQFYVCAHDPADVE